jgi:hypothetical protein
MFAAALVAAALASCSWGRFDDLKSENWVALLERDNDDTDGDFGVDVIALPPPTGQNGIRFVVSLGLPPSGLAQGTFDGSGALVEQIGFDGELGGRGQLTPLNDRGTPFSMARYSDESFIVGVPERNMLIRYNAGLKDGIEVMGESSPPRTGRTVVVGKVFAASTMPDIVTIGQLSLTVIPNGNGTPRTCNLKPPNPASGTMGHTVVSAESLVLAQFEPTFQHIIVASARLDNTPRVLILNANDIVHGMDCPDNGFSVGAAPEQSHVALAVGNIDDNPALDLVGGTLATGGRTGVVTAYLNLTPTTTNPTAMVIPSVETGAEAEQGSSVRGARLRIANIDETPANEIIVADPGASTPAQVSLAGQVQIYRWGGCAGEGVARGPACLVRTLYDPNPDDDQNQFGRGLAVGQFRTAAGERPVLAIAQKGKLWVYFRTNAATPDPRQ